MRPRADLSLCWTLISILLAGGAPAAEASASSRSGQPLLLTVGTDGACSHATLQSALAATAANGPGNDVIHLSVDQTAVSADVFAQSVVIAGGFASCSAFSPTGRTTLDGSGAGSVLTIHGGSASDQHVVLLRDLTITGGDAGFGGGIDVSGGMNVRLEGTDVEDNTASFGGGISVRGASGASVVIAESSQILSNEADQRGGGVYCEDGFVGVFDSAIAFNHADNGGGVAVDGCLLRDEAGGPLRGIFLNDADSFGGGIHASGGSTVEITGSSEAPASVVSNDALSVGGGIWATSSEVQAKHAAIGSNTAGFGGGVGVGIGGSFRMERLAGEGCAAGDRCSTLSGNVADRGGAVYVNSGSGLADIRQTFVEGNFASIEGSAAYVTVFGRLVLEGVVLSDNQGGESVIKLRGDTTGTFAFITMTDNQATDAYIVTKDPTFGNADELEIFSSILWQPGATPLLSFDGATPVTVDCLIVNENLSLPAGDFITVQPPQFVDAAAGDYHLLESSPAVDYCDDAAYEPTHGDIDDQPRGVDDPAVPDNFLLSWYDVGADELSDLIFRDGFESGDTQAWSAAAE